MTIQPLQYDIHDAAIRLGLARTRLFALIKSGELVATREGGRRRITEAECQRFVADRQKVAENEAAARRGAGNPPSSAPRHAPQPTR